MAADPIKAVMVLKTEIDKARTEYQKKLVDFKKLVKKITPKNKKVAASVLNEVATKIEKVRVQILTEKQAVWKAEAELKALRDQIIDQYSHFGDIRSSFMKYAIDTGEKSFG